MTTVIDSLGNITGVGATFSGLIRANAGISASGATFSGNISAPNIVTSVNGATGSVTTYAGTTGNIQFRYGSGVTANNYFDLAEGNLGQITDILTLSGPTSADWWLGNQEAIGLQIERVYYGLGLDEGGGVKIKALGIGGEAGDTYGSTLRIETPSAPQGSNIYFQAGGTEQFVIFQNEVVSYVKHGFYNGINSTTTAGNTFEGPITGVTATFTGLLSASKGISAAGGVTLAGTFSGATGSFSRLLTASAGISAAGATFSGNISAPNIVTSVNGATGSVTTYAGTTGNIQFRYGSGVTATNYFGLTVGNLGQITDILTLSGATLGFDAYYVGNNEALGLQFERGAYGLAMDESGGVAISAKGIYDEGGPYLYGASLHLATPTSDVGSSILFHASGGDQFSVNPTYVYSSSQHIFNNGINSQSDGYTNNFAGPITGATATFTGLVSASKGISAAASTFSSTTNTLDIIASTDGAGLRIAQALTGAASRIGGIRFGRNATSSLNTYIEGSSGTLTIYNGVGATGSKIVDFTATTTGFSGAVSATGLISANAGISAAGGVTFGGTVASDTGYRITSNAINAQTGTTYTFLESDNGKVLTFNNGSAVTVTIPTALPVGFNCTAIQLGAGQVGFTAASGLTLQSYGNQYRLIGQHAAASIIEYSANIVNLSGNLVV
jgi:hypothetical protein